MRRLARSASLALLPALLGCSALSDFDYHFSDREDAGGVDAGPLDASGLRGDASEDAAAGCTSSPCCELVEVRERTCEGQRDEDCDGLLDCADPDCRQSAVCCPTPSFESGESACADGVDNDCDGVIDCDEASCAGIYACTCVVAGPEYDPGFPARCKDDNDNDCDQLLDCDEVECRASSLCCSKTPGQELIESSCADGLNNDCDAEGADCADPDCQSSPGAVANEQGGACRNQLDDDCDGLLDCKDEDCRGALECCVAVSPRESSCSDGKNDDCDAVGLDCFDPDCAADPACCEAPVGGEGDERLCLNGKDDDCDGQADCDDPQCLAVGECCREHLRDSGQKLTSDEVGLCSDRYDNDCDGLINCADPDCSGSLSRACGLGLDLPLSRGARWPAHSPL